ncbi:TrpB-like pyridoxal phosphate-dependent enzyme [Cuniculiplasma sp. SKW4]|uniref:TrpB-like pyridoxal phosphate-dependent enzyme n=1 Tax=Cuniculiplasma sp. SKW4 TaxID=3400171 RepID=UPI003FD4B27D
MYTEQNVDIIPEKWYNIVPDLPEPLPPARDHDPENSSIDLLNRILPKEVLRQEFTSSRYEKIPDEVIEEYSQIGRPTPLIRAKNLEKFLKFTGKIFLKYEGGTVTGSHKINTALPQAYYAANEGLAEVVTETGAGQWGTATALAATLNGLRSTVFMVKVSYDQKPLRKKIMNLYGADVYASPSNLTKFGKEILHRDPEHPGTLGIAISEAVQYALDQDIRYLLGSVENCVITHQSVIGQEAKKQLEILGEKADTLIGCVGGGSNFSGFTFPFMDTDAEMIATAATEVPKFSQGKYKYDLIDTAGILPELKMFSLGADFVPKSIYAGGLRYHGAAPALSLLIRHGRIKTDEVDEVRSLEAFRIFSRTQGIVPAPESSHAIATAIDYCRKPENQGKTVVINVSGHGLLDLSFIRD